MQLSLSIPHHARQTGGIIDKAVPEGKHATRRVQHLQDQARSHHKELQEFQSSILGIEYHELSSDKVRQFFPQMKSRNCLQR